MEALKLLLTFFTLQAFLPMSSTQEASTQGNIFRAYIGASSNGIVLSDPPVHPDVEFHFILAFAVDCTASDQAPTDGIFNVFWDQEHLTSDQVAGIKDSNPNVKVVLSIGGDSCGTNALKFNATSVDSWVSNAVSSLTEIIQDYNLDGIDIDYEQFTADSNTFAECMGQLVTQLKQNGVISIASIAPFDDENVQVYYQALWTSYCDLFDYVNFQFYAYDKGITVSQFVEYFDRQSYNYNGGNILASFATNDGGGLSPDAGFFDACKQLKSDGKLAGIFVWSADDSKGAGFPFEQQAQELLASDGI